MTCKKCNGNLLTIRAICYDNISIETSYGTKLLATELASTGIGVEYDGKTLVVSYCAVCGTTNGNFPLVFNKAPVEEVVEKPTVAEYIQAFYDSTIDNDIKTAERILKWLSVRISPVDYDALATLATNYVGIRKIHPTYPEFDEAVEWMIKRY